MLDMIEQTFEWIGKYGVDRVFLVWFFILYYRSQRNINKIQEDRLEDARQTLHVIMESKQVVGALVEANKELSRRLEEWVLQYDESEYEET